MAEVVNRVFRVVMERRWLNLLTCLRTTFEPSAYDRGKRMIARIERTYLLFSGINIQSRGEDHEVLRGSSLQRACLMSTSFGSCRSTARAGSDDGKSSVLPITVVNVWCPVPMHLPSAWIDSLQA